MLAIIRHGDRTPKQKMKIKVTQVAQKTPASLPALCPRCPTTLPCHYREAASGCSCPTMSSRAMETMQAARHATTCLPCPARCTG